MHTQTNVVFSCKQDIDMLEMRHTKGQAGTDRIFELRVHLGDDGPHALELGEHVVCRAHPAAH